MTLVLIVEDNPINRDVLGRRLERRGYSIRFAEDGPSGIAAARDLMPDVILMDIGLGEMDGCEATRRIKTQQPATLVVGLSLSSAGQIEPLLRQAGASCYVSKDAAGDRLYEAIIAAMKREAEPFSVKDSHTSKALSPDG